MAATKKQKNKKRRPRGTGSIYYDAKRKRYIGQVVVEYGDGSTGKKTVSGITKTEVSDKLRDIQFRAMNGEFLEEKKIPIPTVYEYAEKMMDEQLDYSQSCINKMYQLLGAVSTRRLTERSSRTTLSRKLNVQSRTKRQFLFGL